MHDFLLALLILNVALWSLAWMLRELPEPEWLRRRTEQRVQRVMQEMDAAIKAGLIAGMQKHFPPSS